MTTKTIVLIHGMFMNPLCWENWIPRVQAKGYKVLAPAWPRRDKSEEVADTSLAWIEKVA